jgi:four helix bundle protein
MSVRSNLAEGCGRASRKDFLRFVEIAIGSLNELRDQLLAARDERLINRGVYEQLQSQADLLRRMLVALGRTLQRAIALEEQGQREYFARRSHRNGPL